jgi:hypothetical protein
MLRRRVGRDTEEHEASERTEGEGPRLVHGAAATQMTCPWASSVRSLRGLDASPGCRPLVCRTRARFVESSPWLAPRLFGGAEHASMRTTSQPVSPFRIDRKERGPIGALFCWDRVSGSASSVPIGSGLPTRSWSGSGRAGCTRRRCSEARELGDPRLHARRDPVPAGQGRVGPAVLSGRRRQVPELPARVAQPRADPRAHGQP